MRPVGPDARPCDRGISLALFAAPRRILHTPAAKDSMRKQEIAESLLSADSKEMGVYPSSCPFLMHLG